MDERRQEKRIQTRLVILASNPELAADARIANMSSTGAFIATAHPLPEDSPLAFDIRLYGDSERMTINARVVWAKSVCNATSAGMGIEFTDILERHKSRIACFIEQGARSGSAQEVQAGAGEEKHV